MNKSVRLSATIITYNEEKNIGRCLDSVSQVVDDVVVVDSFSTDKTEEICRAKGIRFVGHMFEGHIEQKNYAMSLAKYDQVLSLDADETLSEPLANSIICVKNNWTHDAYWVNRLTNYCGKWIRHCGWYPDRKIRLWDRRKGCWGGVNPHDKVIMSKNNNIGYLSGNLLHYSYDTLRQNISQINRFSDIAAQTEYEKGRKANLMIDLLLNPPCTFMKKYFQKLGILDGYYGFVISAISAFGRFLKYAKLRELNRKNGTGR